MLAPEDTGDALTEIVVNLEVDHHSIRQRFGSSHFELTVEKGRPRERASAPLRVSADSVRGRRRLLTVRSVKGDRRKPVGELARERLDNCFGCSFAQKSLDDGIQRNAGADDPVPTLTLFDKLAHCLVSLTPPVYHSLLISLHLNTFSGRGRADGRDCASYLPDTLCQGSSILPTMPEAGLSPLASSVGH